jgi:hypothetical protein
VATLVKATPVDGSAPPVPGELAPVAEALAAVVGTARIELLDRLQVVTTDGGSAELETFVPGLEADAPEASCTLTARLVQLAGDEERPGVRIGNLVLWTRFGLPAAPQSSTDSPWEVREGRLTTELSLPVGAPSVIGRAFSDGTGRSVVLVMTARLP